MLMDMIQEKRLHYIHLFGTPPKEIYLSVDFLKYLKAELNRARYYQNIGSDDGYQESEPNAIQGMVVRENSYRPDIKISFPKPNSLAVWY